MKYRTKLIIALVSLAVISCILGLQTETHLIRATLIKDYSNLTKSFAGTTAYFLDPKLVQKSLSEGKQSEATQSLQKTFRKTLHAAKMANIPVDDFFILYPSPKAPNEFLSSISVNINPTLEPHFGTEAWITENFSLKGHLDKAFSPLKTITDSRGEWTAGFAPIFLDGKYLATVGVTLSAQPLFTAHYHLIEYQIIGLFIAMLLAFLISYFISQQITKPLKVLCKGAQEFSRGNLSHRIDLKSGDEFHVLASSLNKMSISLSQRSELKKGFSQYLTHQIIDQLLAKETPFKLKGDTRKVTFLFIMFETFAFLSEKIEPEPFFSAFNATFEKILNIIYHYHGTLDKFLDDQLIIEFGIPLEDSKQEKNAVAAAIEIQKQLEYFQQIWGKEHPEKFKLCIGIHTGEAVIGTIGTHHRKEYTAIGENLSITSQIAKTSSTLIKPILISDVTAKGLDKSVKLEKVFSLEWNENEPPINLYAINNEI